MVFPIPNFRRCLTIGFVLLLIFPVVQMKLRVIKQYRLGGVESLEDPLEFSLSSWLDGSLAGNINQRMTRRIGFRPLCVRTVNQTKLLLSGSYHDIDLGVVIGKQNWLYEPEYIDSFASPVACSNTTEVRDHVSQLKALQQQLAERGKAFLLIITPSKAELYPEYLPNDAVEQRKAFAQRRYCDELRAQLKTQKVHYVDAPEILRRCKPTSAPLFSRTGTHWNYFGCFLVWREVLQVVNQQLVNDAPVPRLAALEYDSPRGKDHDLGNLMNLLLTPGGKPMVPYPIVDVEPAPVAQRPRFLFVGTSFTKTLVDTAYLTKSAQQCDYLFYYKTLHRFTQSDPTVRGGESVPTSLVSPLDIDHLDWQTIMLDKDVVILEFLEINGPGFDFGFCHDALAALRTGRKTR